ncbi:MAG TPA: hypothetical protein VH229_13445, partial [Candidatus Udaeobacter sp.]|nr:hypothetical protein [Candidatus Udaeobacter sp.]
MQRKSTARSAFFTPRTLAVLLLSAVTGFIAAGTLPAFFRSEAPANASPRTLTFAERVAYQRAIEDVYWRHRTWPRNRGERSDAKPSLDPVMSQAQLEKKVADYLRKSQALDDYWQRPITAAQLQGEMDRMAKHTRQPDVLSELFDALGNDPFVIAECLAGPALADRLITSWYPYDERIHGHLRERAEAELTVHNTVEEMKQLGGTYSEIEFVKSDSSHEEQNRAATHAVNVNSREWDQTVQTLAAIFGVRSRDGRIAAFKSAGMSAHSKRASEACESIPTGKVSRLQEDESRYYAMTVIEKTDDHLRLATISWLKEPLESWLSTAENRETNELAVPAASYTLPTIGTGGCIDDTWTATAGPPDGRKGHTAVWTGSEMIVWGGAECSFANCELNTGGRYNPSIDSWTAITAANAPAPRSSHTAVWTGSEMIVWGGYGVEFFNTGGRYNPSTDSWVATSSVNAPSGRWGHTAVWTDSEMIVWGGYDGNPSTVNTGGRYDPSTDSWAATTVINAPTARESHTAVWTGSEMIVWGGFGGNFANTGGNYDPGTDSWTATNTTNAPTAREGHTVVWGGGEMIVWGGYGDSGDSNTGGRYNPVANSWTATSTTNAPTAREKHTAVWTGSEMIVWGGYSAGLVNTGGRYNPSADTWSATSTDNAPDGRDLHTAVWSGSEMIVWGGTTDLVNLTNTGGRYNPSKNSWTNTGINNAPSRRGLHTAIWTGTEMIVWGGYDTSYLNTGGRYTPSMDSWTVTSRTNAPDGRSLHVAVWTGNEMIVWGGSGGASDLNTGGRYNPGTDTWTATSLTGAPSARQLHTAVWGDNEMIIWGGYNGN